MQQTTLQSHSTTHVYYARWYRSYRLIGYIYPIIGTINLVSGIRTHSWWNAISGVAFLLFTPLMVTNWRRLRLVVSPEGIVYHSGGAVLTVPWQDMQYLGRSNTGQYWYRGWEGIMVRDAHWNIPWWLRWYKRGLPKFIPLWSLLNGAWWDRALFDDIFHYAPWLAGYGKDVTIPR